MTKEMEASLSRWGESSSAFAKFQEAKKKARALHNKEDCSESSDPLEKFHKAKKKAQSMKAPAEKTKKAEGDRLDLYLECEVDDVDLSDDASIDLTEIAKQFDDISTSSTHEDDDEDDNNDEDDENDDDDMSDSSLSSEEDEDDSEKPKRSNSTGDLSAGKLKKNKKSSELRNFRYGGLDAKSEHGTKATKSKRSDCLDAKSDHVRTTTKSRPKKTDSKGKLQRMPPRSSSDGRAKKDVTARALERAKKSRRSEKPEPRSSKSPCDKIRRPRKSGGEGTREGSESRSRSRSMSNLRMSAGKSSVAAESRSRSTSKPRPSRVSSGSRARSSSKTKPEEGESRLRSSSTPRRPVDRSMSSSKARPSREGAGERDSRSRSRHSGRGSAAAAAGADNEPTKRASRSRRGDASEELRTSGHTSRLRPDRRRRESSPVPPPAAAPDAPRSRNSRSRASTGARGKRTSYKTRLNNQLVQNLDNYEQTDSEPESGDEFAEFEDSQADLEADLEAKKKTEGKFSMMAIAGVAGTLAIKSGKVATNFATSTATTSLSLAQNTAKTSLNLATNAATAVSKDVVKNTGKVLDATGKVTGKAAKTSLNLATTTTKMGLNVASSTANAATAVSKDVVKNTGKVLDKTGKVAIKGTGKVVNATGKAVKETGKAVGGAVKGMRGNDSSRGDITAGTGFNAESETMSCSTREKIEVEIQSLLDAGTTIEVLEGLYNPELVSRVVGKEATMEGEKASKLVTSSAA